MDYLTGEYEAFIYEGEETAETVLKVSMEIQRDMTAAERELVMENFRKSFYRYKAALLHLSGETFSLEFSFPGAGGLDCRR